MYNTEVQKQNQYNIPKRSRYYQGIIDSKLLEPGTVNFNNLTPVFIIIICAFDPFGEGKYQYTFRMKCDESKDLLLKDGATRIFLNTMGKNPKEVSSELVELLNYMEHTTDNIEIVDSKIKEIKTQVDEIRRDEEIGVKFMQAWEEKIIEREEGRAEGRAEGISLKCSELALKMLKRGFADNDILEIVGISQEELEQLKKQI